uniref:Uncharacterized protein n=1 Tax=viral metagenome TaxID=1070528 RepID=A0A6M3L5F5_9ZZZZ
MEEWQDLGAFKTEMSRVISMKDEEMEKLRKEEIESNMADEKAGDL